MDKLHTVCPFASLTDTIHVGADNQMRPPDIVHR